MIGRIDIARPIAPGIVQEILTSSHDGAPNPFLLKDFRNRADADCPLLAIYLHGSKSNQEQGMTHEIFNNAFDRFAAVFQAKEAVYLCPEYRGNSWMSAAAEGDLLQIIRWAKECYRPQQTVLIGGSMGGTSALIFAARWAELLDGVIAFCPASDVREMAPAFSEQFQTAYGGSPTDLPEEYLSRSVRSRPGKLSQLRIAIVHGSADPLIPPHHSRDLVALLRQQNHPALFYHEMEGGDHNAPLHYPFEPLLEFVCNAVVGEQSA